jgi:hypothetical protein
VQEVHIPLAMWQRATNTGLAATELDKITQSNLGTFTRGNTTSDGSATNIRTVANLIAAIENKIKEAPISIDTGANGYDISISVFANNVSTTRALATNAPLPTSDTFHIGVTLTGKGTNAGNVAVTTARIPVNTGPAPTTPTDADSIAAAVALLPATGDAIAIASVADSANDTAKAAGLEAFLNAITGMNTHGVTITVEADTTNWKATVTKGSATAVERVFTAVTFTGT